MKLSALNETEFDVWPAFTDFVTSVLFIVIIFIFGILFSSVARSSSEEDLMKARQQKVKEQLEGELNRGGARRIEIPQADGSLQRIILQVDEQGRGGVLFERGQARLSREGKGLLDKIVEVLEANRDDYDTIQVEGHTDDVPVHSTSYPSNWELSAARAGAVVNYILEERSHAGHQQLEPWRFSANGRSEFRPYAIEERRMNLNSQSSPHRGSGLQYVVGANEDEEKARRNRRIEIILTYKVSSQGGQL
jgi:flagellar motor protein MotB